MAKCALGPKKLRRIERLTGRKVTGAYVRGGWKHGWAEVFFEGETYNIGYNWPPMVNYHTGEIDQQGPSRPRHDASPKSAVEAVLSAGSGEGTEPVRPDFVISLRGVSNGPSNKP